MWSRSILSVFNPAIAKKCQGQKKTVAACSHESHQWIKFFCFISIHLYSKPLKKWLSPTHLSIRSNYQDVDQPIYHPSYSSYIIHDPVICHHAPFQRFPPHQPNPQRKSQMWKCLLSFPPNIQLLFKRLGTRNMQPRF